jgi:hypothetical protein
MNALVDKEREKHFKIALAMSGAISAGAYTAGVFDFLMEALSEWEKHKLDEHGRPRPGVPQHRVSIVSLAGASAGAITAALGVTSAARGLKETGDRTPVPGKDAFHNLPELYSAWVDSIDFQDQMVTTPSGKKTLAGLLNTTDLVKIKNRKPTTIEITSVLNSESLPVVGRNAVGSGRKQNGKSPWFSDDLHLFLTITNLRGVPYSVKFQSGADDYSYIMSSHGDWAHYRFTDLGTASFRSPWAHAGYFQDIELERLPKKPDDILTDPLWSDYLTNAITSGAFPFGLKAQNVRKPIPAYSKKIFLLPFSLAVMETVRAKWPDKFIEQNPLDLNFTGVDGGALDNDPFQVLRYTLMTRPPVDEPGTDTEADRCVLMISPFPEPPNFELEDDKATRTDLVSVMKGLVSTFTQNSRYKPAELLRTFDVNDVSAWRIGPTRWSGQDEAHAIACGLLGGFGGFLHKEFRRHDYELGRQNCQRFLAHWFGVDKNNPHIDPGCSLPQPIGRKTADNLKVPEERVAIIPLCGTAAELVQVRPWPVVSQDEFVKFRQQAIDRAQALWEALPSQSWWINIGLGAVWRFYVKKRIKDATVGAMATDLVRRNQYGNEQLFKTLSPEEKNVVAIFVKADAQNYTLDELKKALKSQPDTQNNLKIILKDLEDKSILKKSSRFLRSDYWALLFS